MPGPDKVQMHFHFNFSAGEILWTLTFAAQMVLLVVLLGRDRVRRFPWFTASILVAALGLLMSRLLYRRLPFFTVNAIVIVLADVEVLLGLLVLVELARKAFAGIKRQDWLIWTATLLLIDGAILAAWGPWLPWQALDANPHVAALNVMLVVAAPFDQLLVVYGLGKGNLLLCMLTVELGLLIVVFGRRFEAGWRSHTQQIAIGLSTAAVGWLAVQGSWQIMIRPYITRAVQFHSRAEYQHIFGSDGIGSKFIYAFQTIYLAALIWWIVCLWIDEPGTKKQGIGNREQGLENEI